MGEEQIFAIRQIDNRHDDIIGVYDDRDLALRHIVDLLKDQPNFVPIADNVYLPGMDVLQTSLSHKGAWYSQIDRTLICVTPLELNKIVIE
jgi:hypothetical protein